MSLPDSTPSADQIASAHFTLTRTEYLRAVWSASLRRWGFWVGPAFSAVLLIVGVVFLTKGTGWTGVGELYIVLSVALLAIGLGAFQWRFSRQWRENPALTGERELRITQQGLEIRTLMSSGTTDWSVFSKVTELRDAYTIQLKGSRLIVIILKR